MGTVFLWPGWQELDYDVESEGLMVLEVLPPIERPTACPRCGVQEPRVYRWDKPRPEYWDVPHGQRHIKLKVIRQRFKCRECGRLITTPLEQIDPRRNATKRLVEYVGWRAFDLTFAQVARDTGLDEETVRAIWDDCCEQIASHRRVVASRVIGLDETMIARQMRGVVANLAPPAIIDLLPDYSLRTVAGRLRQLEQRERVEVVCMDMHRPYLAAARSVLPDAVPVVDKFHVQRGANELLTEYRRRLPREAISDPARRGPEADKWVFLKRQAELEDRDRLLLDYWQRNVPWIARLYELKEQFFDIYAASSRAEAEDRLHHWLVGIPEELEAWFQPILTYTTNWREEILNYFDHPYTNAGTEALNGLVKLANRNGRGYSFDVLRRRFIYHPRLQREVWRSKSAPGGVAPTHRVRYETYGVDADKLAWLARDPTADVSTLAEMLRWPAWDSG